MKKIVIILISLCLIIIIALGLISHEIEKGYKQHYAIIKNVKSANYPLIQQEFSSKFPEGTKIEYVAITTGKDAIFSVKIIIPNNKVKEFNDNLGFKTQTGLSNKEGIEKIVESVDTSSYMEIRYYKSQSNMKRIDLIKHEPISKEIWDLMNKAGFHSFE